MRTLLPPIVLLAIFLLFSCAGSKKSLSLEKVREEIQAVKIYESQSFLGPCEPSICINPTDRDNIVAGAVLDFVFTSFDGGRTWDMDRMESPYGVYGDPVIRADYDGNFYYAHLSNPGNKSRKEDDWLDRIVIQKSTDGGKSWNEGSYTRPRSPRDQDKHWLAVDPESNHIYMTWTEFDLYGSKDKEHKSRILFAKSTDGGENWTEPLRISQFEGNCEDGDLTPEGAVPSVGIDGTVYVAWSYDSKIYFDRSLDGGETWLDEDLVVAGQPGGWNFDIPGIMRCNGMPVTAVDRSGGKYNGRLYVNWSDQRNGKHDTDIWMAYSDDGGASWSPPVRVNDDGAGNQQFFTWMDVDESTGHVYVVFYDRRHTRGLATDVYLAISEDGGAHFENIRINSESFTPNALKFFGDYNDISVLNGRVRPIWTQLDGKTLSIWTALIDFSPN